MLAKFLFSFFIFHASATPAVTSDDKMEIKSLVRSYNDVYAFDRLLMAMQCVENNLGEGALFQLAVTHPHVVHMIKDST